MASKPIRVYADTSVYGGVFDEEFGESSRAFFDGVGAGRLRLVISPLVSNEIAIHTPQEVIVHEDEDL